MPETGQATAAAWAAAIIRRTDVLYLDTETTGLGTADEIVEIAVLDNAGRVLLDTLVKPRGPIPAVASAIHHITDRQVQQAPAWPDVFFRLSQVLAAHQHVVVYNADFDRRLIAQCCAVHRLLPPHVRWHCAMKQYAAYVGEPSRYSGAYRWFGLPDAVARFGLPVAPDHRAVSDARACRAVVQAMARQQ